jgi:ssDNA-binding Zn-finger/Zn-ribbon topoisomerase 1
MRLKDSRFGPFYGCTTWPDCEGTAAIHQDGSLKSTPANGETKAARIGAHQRFDKLWKEGLMSRSQAYRSLAEYMGLKRKDTHIGYFTEEQCDQVVHFVALMAAEEDHYNEVGPDPEM